MLYLLGHNSQNDNYLQCFRQYNIVSNYIYWILFFWKIMCKNNNWLTRENYEEKNIDTNINPGNDPHPPFSQILQVSLLSLPLFSHPPPLPPPPGKNPRLSSPSRALSILICADSGEKSFLFPWNITYLGKNFINKNIISLRLEIKIYLSLEAYFVSVRSIF